MKLLNKHDYLPEGLCLYTNGVKLTAEGSLIVEELPALERKGLRLILCNPCLNHFSLQENVQAGIIGGWRITPKPNGRLRKLSRSKNK